MGNYVHAAPGVFCRARDTGKVGMVVSAKRPYWCSERQTTVGWEFTLLIEGRLVVTDNFGYYYVCEEMQA